MGKLSQFILFRDASKPYNYLLKNEMNIDSRQNSFSTIASSVAAELIQQSQRKFSDFSPSMNSAQANVKIDGSKAIQVGDIIYNIYNAGPIEGESL